MGNVGLSWQCPPSHLAEPSQGYQPRAAQILFCLCVREADPQRVRRGLLFGFPVPAFSKHYSIGGSEWHRDAVMHLSHLAHSPLGGRRVRQSSGLCRECVAKVEQKTVPL